MKSTIHRTGKIPLPIPREAIYSRLGRNRFLTKIPPSQQAMLEKYMGRAFSLCMPEGVWRRLAITGHSDRGVNLEGGIVLDSAELAKLLSGSEAVLLSCTTAGAEIVRRTAELAEQGDGVAALVYDATGSETADSALDWLHEAARRQLSRRGERLTVRRFSPGYGDLTLENQKILFELLGLRQIGISLTEMLTLTPEKTVIAIAGIEKTLKMKA